MPRVVEGAARARWSRVSFAAALASAPKLDILEKDILLALAGAGLPEGIAAANAGDPFRPLASPWRRADFARELAAWITRFDLADAALEVEVERLGRGELDAHYGVRPARPMVEMPAVLRPLPHQQSLAALALLALFDGD